jgi:hypothetical protein
MVIVNTYILQLNTSQISLNNFKIGRFLDQRLCTFSRQCRTNIKVVTQLNLYPTDRILNFWYVVYKNVLF